MTTTVESLWHTIPRGLDDKGKVRVFAAVTPISTAAGQDPAPPIWHKWPNSVMGLKYHLEYRTTGGPWNSNLVDLDLVRTPNEQLWEVLFPEVNALTTRTAARQPAVDATFPATSHSARRLANNILALYGTMLVSQSIRAAHVARGVSNTSTEKRRALAEGLRVKVHQTLESFSLVDHSLPQQRVRTARQEVSFKAQFANWVRTNVSGSNRAKALMAERNVYRLSARPYDNLADFVFQVILTEVDQSQASLARANSAAAALDPFQTQLVKAAIFHSRCRSTDTASTLTERACDSPNYNWAQKISLLDNYPNLLKELGLVLEFRSKDPVVLPTKAEVRIVPLDKSSSAAIASQSSVTRLQDGTFFAANSDALPNGAVLLDSSEYELIPVDVDGAALKLLQAGDSAARSNGRFASSRTPELRAQSANTLPSLRNAGIGLFRNEQAAKMTDQLQKDQAKRKSLEEGNEVPPLDAAGLVRGYIPEVRQITSSGKSGPWRQLTLRKETFEIKGYGTLQCAAKASLVRWAATTAKDSPRGENPSDDLHIHEALLHWRGWSLGVPLPFDPLPQEEANCSNIQQVFPMQLTSEIPDTDEAKLLPLRIGATYEMRLRTMDMACEVSPEVEGLPSLRMTWPLCRFEPVAAPSVLLENVINNANSPGEGVEFLLVRTSDGDDENGPPAIRTLVPPRTTLEMAEMLGCFDHGLNPFTAGSFDAVKLICHRTPDGREYGDFPTDGVSENALYQVPTEEPPSGLYFPDPLAEFLVTEVDDMTRGGSRVKAFDPMPFYRGGDPARWPKAMRYQIGVVKSVDLTWGVQDYAERRFPPYGDEHVRRLVIGLPPAWKVILRIRSRMSREKMGLMAGECLANYALPHLSASPEVAAFSRESGLGAVDLVKEASKNLQDFPVDMLTPARELTLVHAVSKPLLPPSITLLCANRQMGETSAGLRVSVEADRKSTSKVDIKAQWEEWIDDPNVDRLVKTPANAQIGTIDVPEEPEGNESPNSRAPIRNSTEADASIYAFRQAFADTNHRYVTYFPVATSRFQRFFKNQNDPARFQLTGTGKDQQPVQILNTRRPSPPDIAYVVPLFDWKPKKKDKHSFASTRCGGGLRIYLRRPWYQSGQNEKIGIVLWGEKQTQTNVAPVSPADSCTPLTSSNFAADQGEPLLRHYVTRWGADPEWSDSVPTNAPLSTMFARETFHEELVPSGGRGSKEPDKKTNPDDLRQECGVPVHGLSLEEIEPELSASGSGKPPLTVPTNPALGIAAGPPRCPVSVVTYDPRYDSKKQLWYCDVFLSQVPSYSCFIRLAVVRYQPYSLRYAECSHVSLAAFAQLPANRSVTVRRSCQKHSIEIEVRGTCPGDSALSLRDSTKRNEFDLIIEHARPGIDGPLHWREEACVTACIVEKCSGSDPTPLLCKETITFQEPRGKKRLVVKEYEWKSSDGEQSGSQGDHTVRRLVFADVLSLPDF